LIFSQATDLREQNNKREQKGTKGGLLDFAQNNKQNEQK
jgi:hypothetical protein